MNMSKVAFIGIDGLEISIVKGLKDQGFINDKVSASFYPIQLNLLDRGWATIFTGKDASYHNGYYWRTLPNTYCLSEKFNAEMIEIPTIWDRILMENGRVGLLGIPTTFPAKPVNGFYVASGGGGASLTTDAVLYPPEIKDIIDAEAYQYDVRFPDFIGKKPVRFINTLTKADETRWKVARKLLKEFNPLNFFAVVFTGADRIQHFFWDRVEKLSKSGSIDDEVDQAILGYYQAIFKILEKMIDELSSNKVVIASDHGFCRYKKSVNIVNLLSQKGYVRKRKFRVNELGKQTAKFIIPHTLRPYLSLLRRKTTMGGEWRLNPPSIDFSKSLVVPFSGLQGLYLNEKNRFPHGVIESDESDAICSDICNYLKGIKDYDSGVSIFQNITSSKEVYTGPYAHLAPNVVFDLPPGYKLEADLFTIFGDIQFKKIYPTKRSHMPGQGHIGIHATPAAYACFKHGNSVVTENIDTLSAIYKILLADSLA